MACQARMLASFICLLVAALPTQRTCLVLAQDSGGWRSPKAPPTAAPPKFDPASDLFWRIDILVQYYRHGGLRLQLPCHDAPPSPTTRVHPEPSAFMLLWSWALSFRGSVGTTGRSLRRALFRPRFRCTISRVHINNMSSERFQREFVEAAKPVRCAH